jgi:hypothetical protein
MRTLSYVVLFLFLVGPLAPLTGQPRPQNNALKRMMTDKVKNAQALLEGLAMADYAKVTRSAEELIRISNTAEWVVHKTARYETYGNEFRRAAEDIIQKAKAKNIDGVALGYGDLVRSCVRCHQYVREVQDARLPSKDSGVALATRYDSPQRTRRGAEEKFRCAPARSLR